VAAETIAFRTQAVDEYITHGMTLRQRRLMDARAS
jgi:hypothetical protein